MLFTSLLRSRDAYRVQRLRKILLATTMAAVVVLGPVAGLELARAQGTSAPGTETALPSLSPLVKKVMPAVVNISVVETNETNGGSEVFPESPFDQYLRRFFQNQGINPQTPAPSERQQVTALGSGFIIDPSGLIVTNNHVVDGAKKVTVLFQDGTKHPAKILGRDPKTDLALLKVDVGHPLPYVSWGDSGHENVGDWVVAIGNPFGLGGTVSAGIISARGRDIGAGPYDDFLQIDAPINRGNSGGPTFNLEGQVVGINTAIYSPNGGSVGIGFAIPSSLARPVIEELRAKGKVSRGWLGVQIQEVTPALAKSLDLPREGGALVADITKGSPAESVGFEQGDVIETFNGHEIQKVRDLPILVAETGIGTTAKVTVWRHGKEITLSPLIAEQPANLGVASRETGTGNGGDAQQTPQRASVLGLKLAPLTPELRKQVRAPANIKGVVVTEIEDSSPLVDLDLEAGDVIVAINQEPVSNPREAVAKLKAAQANKRVLLQINRHGVNAFVAWSGNPDNG